MSFSDSPKNPPDPSWIPSGMLRDEWQTIQHIIRDIVPASWIRPRPSQENDGPYLLGYVAGDPLHPERLLITWKIYALDVDGERMTSIQAHVMDAHTAYIAEASGIFFGKYHRSISDNGRCREIPCTPEGSSEIHVAVTKLAKSLISGTRPRGI